MLKEALQYIKKGYSVFPLHYRSKIPCLPWEKYQNERADVEQVSDWFSIDRNIAIVTGAISGLVVIDVDTSKGGEHERILYRFPTDMIVKTGKGFHLYYAHPGWHVDNAVNFLPGVDVRGDGGYVVAPPSIHPNGNIYEWINATG